MKKIYMMIFAAMAMSLSSCEYDDTALNDRIEDLEERVARLEEICNQMNSDVAALQKLVAALQSQVSVVDVEPLIEDGSVVGSVIHLSNGETVVIRDGKAGMAGTDGADGVDGYVPAIGTKTGSDGILYWTIDGKWLLDANGDKVPVNGKDGADGQNGTDGQDGQDGSDGQDGRPGADGKDGNCPLFRIENGMWLVSYTGEDGPWYELGKADGDNGENGSAGDGLFKDIVVGTDEVTFILNDGTEFSLPLGTHDAYHRIQSVTIFPMIDPLSPLFSDDMPNFTLAIYPGLEYGEGRAAFMVAPKEALKDIASDWQNMLKFEILFPEIDQTKATQVKELEIRDVVVDENTGIVSFAFKVHVPREILIDMMEYDWYYSAYFMLRICDGKNEICSDAMPVYTYFYYSEIGYVSTSDKDLFIPENLESKSFLSDSGDEIAYLLVNHPAFVLEKEIFAGRDDISALRLIDFALIEEGTFANLKNLHEIIIDYDDLKSTIIGKEAFAGSSLESAEVYLVSEIQDRAFADCPNFKTLTLNCLPPKLGTDVFGNHIPDILVDEFLYDKYMKSPDWAPYADYLVTL